MYIVPNLYLVRNHLLTSLMGEKDGVAKVTVGMQLVWGLMKVMSSKVVAAVMALQAIL